MSADLTPAEREALGAAYAEWLRFPFDPGEFTGAEPPNDPQAEAVQLFQRLLRAVPRLAGEERDRLAGFASWVLEQHTGTIDGCDIEEAAVRFGLMDAVTCDGTCADCEGAVPGEDTCYRPHRLLNNEGSAE